jgi:translation initiation factor IF-1
VNTLTAIIKNVLGTDLVRMEITDTHVGVTLDIWGKTARHEIIVAVSDVLTMAHV